MNAKLHQEPSKLSIDYLFEVVAVIAHHYVEETGLRHLTTWHNS